MYKTIYLNGFNKKNILLLFIDCLTWPGSMVFRPKCTWYLVVAPFALISAPMPVALLRYYGGQGGFESCFRLVYMVSLLFLLTIPHKFYRGFSPGKFAPIKNSDTEVIKPFINTQILLKKTFPSPRSLSAKGSMKCSEMLWYMAALTWYCTVYIHQHFVCACVLYCIYLFLLSVLLCPYL